MAFGAQVAIPANGYIDTVLDPGVVGPPYVTVGPANSIEIATGPVACTLVFECNNDGIRRSFTNLNVGMGWTGLTITKVYGAADGTTATAVRLRWGTAT
jgi:hypothetical protein